MAHGSKIAQHGGQSAMKHVRSFHRSVIHGHAHRAGFYWLTTANGTLQGHGIGCLYSLTPSYMFPPVNWQRAMTAATVEPDGHTIVQLLPIQAGRYVIFGREKISR